MRQFTKQELRHAYGELISRLMAMFYVDDEWTLEEVGALFNVSRERVRQRLDNAGVARRSRTLRTRINQGTKVLPVDRRRVEELARLGMSAVEGFALLGYSHPTVCRNEAKLGRGAIKRMGTWRDRDYTWRGWKERWMLEVRKLIAADALGRGATHKEASEVSGLAKGSISVWSGKGVLPRSKHKQGVTIHRPTARTVENVPELYLELIMAWNVGMKTRVITRVTGKSSNSVRGVLCRMRAMGFDVVKRKAGVEVRTGQLETVESTSEQ